MTTVYPRTGGGNSTVQPKLSIIAGLSPHGRGKRTASHREGLQKRSIPARAGETCGPWYRWQTLWVYPRTGGGNC